MEVEEIREIIYTALEKLQSSDRNVELHAIGNTVHLILDNDEFEIVIKTMRPMGSRRLSIKID
jgi:hypothetical protein